MRNQIEHPYFFELLKAMVIYRRLNRWERGIAIPTTVVEFLAHPEKGGISASPGTLRKILKGSYKSQVGLNIKNEMCQFVRDYGDYEDFSDFQLKEYWPDTVDIPYNAFYQLTERNQRLINERIASRLEKLHESNTGAILPVFTLVGEVDIDTLLSEGLNDIRMAFENLKEKNQLQMILIGVFYQILESNDDPKLKLILQHEKFKGVIEEVKKIKASKGTFEKELMSKIHQFNGREYFYNRSFFMKEALVNHAAHPYYFLGLVLFALQRYAEAIQSFCKVPAHDPTNFSKAQLRTSEIYLHLKRPDFAQQFLDKAIAFHRANRIVLSPQEKTEVHLIQGEIFYGQKLFYQAFSIFDRQFKFLQWVAGGHYGKYLQARLYFNLSHILPQLRLSAKEERNLQIRYKDVVE